MNCRNTRDGYFERTLTQNWKYSITFKLNCDYGYKLQLLFLLLWKCSRWLSGEEPCVQESNRFYHGFKLFIYPFWSDCRNDRMCNFYFIFILIFHNRIIFIYYLVNLLRIFKPLQNSSINKKNDESTDEPQKVQYANVLVNLFWDKTKKRNVLHSEKSTVCWFDVHFSVRDFSSLRSHYVLCMKNFPRNVFTSVHISSAFKSASWLSTFYTRKT